MLGLSRRTRGGVARLIRHSGQNTVKVSLQHENRANLMQSIAHVSSTLRRFQAITERWTIAQRWGLLLTHIFRHWLGGKWLGELPAEIAFCLATGNTARMRELDCGLIELGRSADFVLMDKAQHSPGKTLLDSVRLGDLPGIGMTIIDGIVRTQRSRNTPPATKVPEIVSGH